MGKRGSSCAHRQVHYQPFLASRRMPKLVSSLPRLSSCPCPCQARAFAHAHEPLVFRVCFARPHTHDRVGVESGGSLTMPGGGASARGTTSAALPRTPPEPHRTKARRDPPEPPEVFRSPTLSADVAAMAGPLSTASQSRCSASCTAERVRHGSLHAMAGEARVERAEPEPVARG